MFDFGRAPESRSLISRWLKSLDRPMKWAFSVSLLALMAHWGIVAAFVIPRLGNLGFLRLHYTARQGIDWVDIWYVILVFPTVATLTLIINAIIAARFAIRNKSLGRLLLVITALIEILMTVGGVLVVLLNG